jgi:hypothetical protein
VYGDAEGERICLQRAAGLARACWGLGSAGRMDSRAELAPRAAGLEFLGPRATTTATSPAAAAGIEPSTGTSSATATGTRASSTDQRFRTGNDHGGNE